MEEARNRYCRHWLFAGFIKRGGFGEDGVTVGDWYTEKGTTYGDYDEGKVEASLQELNAGGIREERELRRLAARRREMGRPLKAVRPGGKAEGQGAT